MTRPAKKSESLEIRIPYATKSAFMARCRAEGASASETLRSFIEAHLAGERPASSRRPRTWLRLAAGAAAAVGVGATALPSLARPLERARFERLDADRNGLVAPAEFAAVTSVSVRVDLTGALPALNASDMPLQSARPAEGELKLLILQAAFRRLDRDGSGALSFGEFRRR